MRIEKIGSNTFDGKFIKAKNLTKADDVLLERFMQYEKLGKTNKDLLKRKSYDVFVSRADKEPGKLVVHSKFDRLYDRDPVKCYIGAIHKDPRKQDFDTNNFRSSLSWFEYYKKSQDGYNNFLECMVATIKDLLDM